VNLGLRAAGRLNGGTGRAGFGLRALDKGATGTRARRTFTDLTGLVTCADTGRAGGNC